MNCFHHPGRPAVAICKSCCKGLCGECAAEVPNGMACKNACEERVRWLNELIDQSAPVRAVANSQIRSARLFVLFIGILFVACAVWQFPENKFFAYWIGGIGFFLLVYGASQLFTRKYPALDAPPQKGNESARGEIAGTAAVRDR